VFAKPENTRIVPPPAAAANAGGGNAEHPTNRKARSADKTRDGRLPVSHDTKLYVGHGTNTVCAGCDDEITGKEMEYETDQTETLTLRFHRGCYDAWKSESSKTPSP
jgi:hypothetical protein